MTRNTYLRKNKMMPQEKIKTVVVSVDHKPFEELFPNKKNAFDSFTDAFKFVVSELQTNQLAIRTKKEYVI